MFGLIFGGCLYCKKVVWPWQKEYLGLTKAHAKCDAKSFKNDIMKFAAKGYMTHRQATDNIKNRNDKAYF